MVFNCAIESVIPGDIIWIKQAEKSGWQTVTQIVDCTSDKVAPVFFICWGDRSEMAVYPGTSFTVLRS